MHRRAIGDEEPGRLRIVQPLGDRDGGLGIDDDPLTRSAIAQPGGDTLTDAEAGDASAQGSDDAGAFGRGREGQGRLGLVAPLNDQRVEEVERCRLDRDGDLPRAGLLIGQIAQHQALGRSQLLAEQCLHCASPRLDDAIRFEYPPQPGESQPDPRLDRSQRQPRSLSNLRMRETLEKRQLDQG